MIPMRLSSPTSLVAICLQHSRSADLALISQVRGIRALTRITAQENPF